MTIDRAGLEQRYNAVKASLPSNVKLIAVSKTRTVEEIQALYDRGHRAFGENYPQEVRDKQARLPADIEWHFIGHLQSNKVKYIAPFIHLVHADDGEKLLNEIQKRASSAERTIDVLLQVHIAEEETKHGLNNQEIGLLLENDLAAKWPNVRIRGLMGMATNTENELSVSKEFAELNELFLSLRTNNDVDPTLFSELSMGMSGDAQLAIANGSTMVRIGTAIFGER